MIVSLQSILNLQMAILLTTKLLSITMLIQGFETLILSQKKSFLTIYSYKNLKSNLEQGLPILNRHIQFLFSEDTFKKIAILQILLAAITLFYPNLFCIIGLFLTYLLVCIRYRGIFNGGSDMMTFVVLTGVIIFLSSHSEEIQKLGLIYIAIHTSYSYFKAGLVKIVHSEWRNGLALPAFLKRSVFVETHAMGKWLQNRKLICFILCWGVLIFELTFVGLLYFPKLILFYFLIAIAFHFLVYLSFGLNRFFWIWASAWSATIYSILLLVKN